MSPGKITSTYGWPWDKLGIWPDGRRPWHRATIPRNRMGRPQHEYGPGVMTVCWYGWVKFMFVLGLGVGLLFGFVIGVLVG